MAREYLNDMETPDETIYKSFIVSVLESKANLAVIPMQDYLGYDDSARMNQPSTVGINWKWRMKKSDISEELKQEIYEMTKKYERLNK